MKVSKTLTFDAAHQLVGHFGKCANLHGHTYKVEISLAGETFDHGSSQGMVVDFYHVKKIAGKFIDRLDHAVLLQGNEPIALANAVDTKRVLFGFRTTAENMSRFLTWVLTELMWKHARIDSIKLWETPTGCAECTYYEIFTDREIEMFKNVKFIEGNSEVTVAELLEE
jgi:6-pyruvoyltetrahydropterin/6-carboxytetrahydropterin synthase|nr:MAG TPA: 6-pyruvoyl tetrahydropterin synthase [Caudoviricetes sp.]